MKNICHEVQKVWEKTKKIHGFQDFKKYNGPYPDIFEYATGMHSWPYQRTYK